MHSNHSRRKSGFILAIVIMSIMVMFVLVMGILSRNSSRAISSEATVKRTQAELVAKSALWKANEALRVGGTLTDYVEIIDGVSYTVTYTSSPGTGPNGTTEYNINVSYPDSN